MGTITSKKDQQLQPVEIERKEVVGRWRHEWKEVSEEVRRNYETRRRFFRKLFKAK